MEKWDFLSSLSFASIAALGRNSSTTYNNCLQVVPGASIGKAIPNTQVVTAGFALNPNLLSGGAFQLVQFNDSAKTQISINVTGGSQLQVVDGNGNVLGTTSTPQIVTNTYTYLEFQVVFSTGSTGSCTIQVNGVNVLALTGINTAVSGNAYTNSMLIYGADGTSNFDDLYICDGTGAYNTTFLGDIRVALALPNATGRLSQWTRTGGTASGNYTAVDEVPPNNNTSYVSSSTVGNIDAYGISSIGSPTAIIAVQLVACARKTDAASRSIGLGFGNATTDNFDSGHSITNSYIMYRRIMDVNPLTSAAWAPTDLTTAQIALNVVA